jgi:hypothetical protein
MKVKTLMLGVWTFGVALSLASGATFAQTQEKKDEKKPAPTTGAQPTPKPAEKPAAPAAATKPADKPLGGQPDSDKMMAEMVKMGEPTEFHGHLKPLAGKWSYVTKARMTPEQPWDESKGTAEFELALGGRFLIQKCKNEKDEKMPFPFEGLGITGYDKMQKKYVNVWMDNMGTGIMTSTGTCDSSGKTFTYTGEYDDPMTGGKQKAKSVHKFVGSDKHVFEMYGYGPDGKEFQSLEVTYTKK